MGVFILKPFLLCETIAGVQYDFLRCYPNVLKRYSSIKTKSLLFFELWGDRQTNTVIGFKAIMSSKGEIGVEQTSTVLIVHNYYQIPGGEDTVVANEKEMLERYGHTVILYTRNNLELKEFGKKQKLLLPFTTIYNLRTSREIKTLIREKKIDLVHVHNTLNLISPSVYYAALSMGVPVVQTVHNFRLLCPNALFYRDEHVCEDCISKGLVCAVKHNCYRGNKLQTLAYVLTMKIHRILKTYAKIDYICLTEFNRQKLLNLKQIKKDRIFVKPNFVKSIREFVPKEERAEYLIFAGRLDKLKGVDLLLKAWKKMDRSAPELLICGVGPMEEWCRDFIEENNIPARMLGFVSNIEVRNLIAYSKALIFPTQCYEGFPMSIVEAFSVGTPVISSDIGNAGNVVVEGVSGYKFQKDSADSLIAAVDRLKKMPTLYDSTFKTYRDKYTEPINYTTLMSIYRSVSK